jgi:two-component system, NtrC family, response regulator AtoC
VRNNSSRGDSAGAGQAPPTFVTTGTAGAVNESGPARALWLSVAEDGRAWSVPLPNGGTISIGRAPESDVVLRNPLVSRQHALIKVGPPLTVTDAQSANGTKIGERAIAGATETPLNCGDTILVGSAALVVHGRGMSQTQLRQQVGLDDLLERLPRLAAEHPAIVLARLRIASDLHVQWITALLCQDLPASAVVTWGGRGVALVALPTAGADDGAPSLGALVERLRAWGARVEEPETRYLVAPVDREQLAAGKAFLRRQRGSTEVTAASFVVRDPSMVAMYDVIDRVAPAAISVLLLGETGVGKEIVATAIHARSPRCHQPFVRLNCAALSESLLESELFGHEAGSFTGARGAKRGLLEAADKGTVLLDEVGDLPLSMQVKLLRVIETRELLRIGGLTPRVLDVRFVAATNRDLADAVKRGTFREDLLFRLNAVTIRVPPLRDRPAELEPLVDHFAELAASQIGRRPPRLDRMAMERLRAYSWPGNVRELRNVVERAVLLCADAVILPEDLPPEVLGAPPAPAFPAAPAPPAPAFPAPDEPGLDHRRRDVAADEEAAERERIISALVACAGNQTRAAELLAIPRRTLVKRLRQYQIPRPRTERSQS